MAVASPLPAAGAETPPFGVGGCSTAGFWFCTGLPLGLGLRWDRWSQAGTGKPTHLACSSLKLPAQEVTCLSDEGRQSPQTNTLCTACCLPSS